MRKPGLAAAETGIDTDNARIHAHGEPMNLTDAKGLGISIGSHGSDNESDCR